MKKVLLYLLLFSYTTIMLKPVLPSLTDFIAHIFWYSEHVATVHYEHGKYHVHYEYQEAAKKNFPEKDASLPKSETTDSEHLVNAEAYQFPVITMIQTHFFIPASHLLHTHLNNDFPPPKV